jgi:hypothetical protein
MFHAISLEIKRSNNSLSSRRVFRSLLLHGLMLGKT